MMYRITVAIFLLASFPGWTAAQPFSDPKTGVTNPIFRSAADSLQVARLEHELSVFFSTTTGNGNNTKVDSMLQRLAEARMAGIVGMRDSFKPRYISLDEALRMPPDSVRSMTLTAISTWPKELDRFPNLEVLEVLESPIRKLQPLRKLARLTTLYLLNPVGIKPLHIPRKLAVKNLMVRGGTDEYVPNRFSNRHLEQLNLAGNLLIQMPNVRKATRLRGLVLRRNQIGTFEAHGGNPHLLELELQENKLREIPDDIAGFAALRKLILSRNEIRDVSPALAELKNLEELAFYRNALQEIPAAVYHLNKLRALDLYYNEIQAVGEGLGALQNLEVLYLSHNKLRSLPDALCSLTGLQELYFHNNRISVLPKHITQLTNLRVLRMNDNLITELPEGFAAFTRLDFLDLSRNRFSQLPVMLGDYPVLEILSLSDNPLEEENRTQWLQMALQLRQRGVVVNLAIE